MRSCVTPAKHRTGIRLLLVLGLAVAGFSAQADAQTGAPGSCERTLARAAEGKINRGRRCARRLTRNPAFAVERCFERVAERYAEAVAGLPCVPRPGRGIEDWGWADQLRANADVNGDGLADYCRFVGSSPTFLTLSCQLKQPDGFYGEDRGFNSRAAIDRGHRHLPSTLTDVSGDGRADYCRYVGPVSAPFRACALATDSGFAQFGDAAPRPIADWGYAILPRAHVDVNGDWQPDYCRFVGDFSQAFLACQLKRFTGGYGYDYAYVSPIPIRAGTATSTAVFSDVNGDGRVDFCQTEKLGIPADRPKTWIDVRSCHLAGPEGFSPDPVVEPHNECATGEHDCSLNATCTDTADSWECSCRAGFVGDGSTCAPAPPIPCAGDSALCDRRYDEVAFPTTHNSFAVPGFFLPNQQSGIEAQLDGGIRGFMLDVHYDGSTPALCHGNKGSACAGGSAPLVENLEYIRDFLAGNENEIVTLILESYVSPWSIVSAFNDAKLTQYVYAHGGDPNAPWPTLRQMIKSNTRLVVMAVKGHQESPPPWFHDAWYIGWETDYELRADELVPGPAHCNASPERANRGRKNNPLMTFNHFVGTPLPFSAGHVNSAARIVDRAEKCISEGQFPNFVTVDYWERGDVVEAVRQINLNWPPTR